MAVVNSAVNFGLSDANDMWSLFTDENSQGIREKMFRAIVLKPVLCTSLLISVDSTGMSSLTPPAKLVDFGLH